MKAVEARGPYRTPDPPTPAVADQIRKILRNLPIKRWGMDSGILRCLCADGSVVELGLGKVLHDGRDLGMSGRELYQEISKVAGTRSATAGCRWNDAHAEAQRLEELQAAEYARDRALRSLKAPKAVIPDSRPSLCRFAPAIGMALVSMLLFAMLWAIWTVR